MRHKLPILALLAVALATWAGVSSCHAGIVLPQQVGFDAQDLEKALTDQGSATARASRVGGTASTHRTPSDWQGDESPAPHDPFELVKSQLPTGNTSSSTSTSSTVGGATGSGTVCLLSTSLSLKDDSPLGQLAEDHGLALPDAPGTDLLRPPRL